MVTSKKAVPAVKKADNSAFDKPAQRRATGRREDGMLGKKQFDPERVGIDPNKPEVFGIKCDNSARLRSVVPGSVFRQPPFKWTPTPFAVEHEKFDGKFVGENLQKASLKAFVSDPSFKGIFCVAGNPDDMMAKYLAAFLVMKHQQAFPNSMVKWEQLYGGFENKLIKEPVDGLTMLVISNITPDSTPVKLEKARDLLEHYNNIPRVVVAAGCDPISMLCGKLHVPINGMVYLQGKTFNSMVV